ncbi:EAL domain-containing protein [Ferrimicrobium sp.]|uniref:putative bifunctional diguanylate cyclase/phosphodiesterase n=1 Tax=Ferrimicrobium sp. TaxID=2926050 RepID=UPI00261401A1|nr:EAL domain-containing protein [Ferrimicrobium sp.]MCL5973535.1 EAL domain-containing protein [Actinomycetota bacterium]
MELNSGFGPEPGARRPLSGAPASPPRRPPAQVIKALRRLVPQLCELIRVELSGFQESDPTEVERIARLITAEFIRLFSEHRVDYRVIARVGDVHMRMNIRPTWIDRIYTLYRSELAGVLDADEQGLLLLHEKELLATTAEASLRLWSAREALQQTIVEVANLFGRYVQMPESQLGEQLVEMIQRATQAPLVYLATVLGTPETGLGDQVTIAVAAGPARTYAMQLDLRTDPNDLRGQGPVGIALRSGHVTLGTREMDSRFETWINELKRYDLASAIVVPFPISLNRSGALALYRRESDPIPIDIEDMMGALGSELGRLFQARTAYAHGRLLERILESKAGLQMSTATDWVVAMRDLAEALIGEVSIRQICLLRADPSAGVLRCAGIWGDLSPEARQELLDLEVTIVGEMDGLSATARCFRFQQDLVTNGLIQRVDHHDLPEMTALLAHGSAILRIPIVIAGQSHGVLVLAIDDQADQGIGDDVVSAMDELVHQAIARVEHNRSEWENRWLNNLTLTVLQSASIMVSAQSEVELLQSFCEVLVTESVFTSSWVAAPNAAMNRLVPMASAGRGADEVGTLLVPLDLVGEGPLVLRAIRSDAVVWNQDELADDAVSPWLDFLRTFGWNCGVAVPIHKNGRVFAALTVMSQVTNTITPAVISLLETVVKMIEQGIADLNLKQALERERNIQRLAARTDMLTGLDNRLAFEEKVRHLLVSGREVAVGILDLDGFKELNDTAGHWAGDKFLESLGSGLRSLVDGDDFVSRLGGDEFGFCVADGDYRKIDELVEHVMRLVAEVGQEFRITGSLGWSMSVTDGRDYPSLLAHADEALYAAKDAGKARSYLFGGMVARSIELRRQVRDRLPTAIETGELYFALQPKVNGTTGAVVGVELLMRWDGVPLESVLKEVQSDPELARMLGNHAIRSALTTHHQLTEAGYPDLNVSLNVTPSHFLSTHFPSDVALFASEDPWHFTVEITEDVALDDLAAARSMIGMLHSVGVAVSVDDFGTGYASLSNVALLDVDELKIDRSFISRFGMDVNSFAVVSSLSFLARIAGIKVVAEGVETVDELSRWIRLGGQLVQGYLYSRPIDFEALLGVLARAELLHLPATAFAVEDFLLLNDALVVGRHLDSMYKESFQECPFFDWFTTRGSSWGNLASFDAAASVHEQLHQRSMGRSVHPALAAHWVRHIQALREDISSRLR